MNQLQTILNNQPLFLLLLVWSLIWKGLALWRAARREDKLWYVILLVLNTAGIAEIVYLLMTQKKVRNNQTENPKV